MEGNCSLQSNMRSTRGRCCLSEWETGCTRALGCQGVSTANSLALRRSASVRTGSTLLSNTWNQTSFSRTLHHTHGRTWWTHLGVMPFCPGTSNIRPTLKWFPPADPWPYHARSEDVIVLLTSMFPGLGQTLSAAGVNTYLRITVKLLATLAKSVSLKSLHLKTNQAQINSSILPRWNHIYS